MGKRSNLRAQNSADKSIEFLNRLMGRFNRPYFEKAHLSQSNKNIMH